MNEELFKLIVNNSSGIAIFAIAVLLLIREIFTFLANERRRKSDKWIYLEVLRDGIVSIEKDQKEFKILLHKLIELEKMCNESQSEIFVIMEKDLELARECREKLEILCKNCLKNPIDG